MDVSISIARLVVALVSKTANIADLKVKLGATFRLECLAGSALTGHTGLDSRAGIFSTDKVWAGSRIACPESPTRVPNAFVKTFSEEHI